MRTVKVKDCMIQTGLTSTGQFSTIICRVQGKNKARADTGLTSVIQRYHLQSRSKDYTPDAVSRQPISAIICRVKAKVSSLRHWSDPNHSVPSFAFQHKTKTRAKTLV